MTITSDIVYDAAITGGSYQIHRALISSTSAIQITTDTDRDNWWPVRSPGDGRLYYCSTPVGTHDTSPTAFQQMTIRSCRMDGTDDKQVLGLPATVDATWTQYGHPEFNPAGTRMAVFAVTNGVYSLYEFNTTTWATVAQPRLMAGSNACVDPSYSPDGTKIVFAEAVSGVPRVSTVLSGGSSATPPTVLVSGGAGIESWWDPYYSPDGTQIAALAKTGSVGAFGEWAIKKFTAAGASVTTVIDDGNINSKPSWTSDGLSVVFHRLTYPVTTTFQLYQIDVDGTDLAAVQYVASNVNGEYPRVLTITDTADPSPDLFEIGRRSQLQLEGSVA
jgi:Tol biopolymer transport system component